MTNIPEKSLTLFETTNNFTGICRKKFDWIVASIVFKFFKKIILKKINFIRAINKKIYDDLIDLNYPKECVLEIPNGINSKNFLGLQKNKREISHFGYVGRLVQIIVQSVPHSMSDMVLSSWISSMSTVSISLASSVAENPFRRK